MPKRPAPACTIFLRQASAGEYLLDLPESAAQFDENDLDIGQNWQDNGYVKSKFLAEQQVRQAVQNGLDARIYRVGRLVVRQRRCVPEKSGAKRIFRLLQSIAVLGAMPDCLASVPVDLTPVDVCAREIVALREGGGRVWHLLGAFIRWSLRLGRSARSLPLCRRKHFPGYWQRGWKPTAGGSFRACGFVEPRLRGSRDPHSGQ